MAYIMINGNKVYWEDYLELAKKLKEIDDLPKVVNGIVSWNKSINKDVVKTGSQVEKVLNSSVDNKKINGVVKDTTIEIVSQKGQDFDIDKKNYTKHVLIERLVIKDEYEFNFIDLETKEFYWSYYTSDRNYNVAKKAFENIFKYKGVKYYLEE